MQVNILEPWVGRFVESPEQRLRFCSIMIRERIQGVLASNAEIDARALII